MMTARDDVASEWRHWLKNPWVWPLPAVLLHACVLVFSSRVWTERVPGGRGGHTIPAHTELWMLGGGFLVYALTLLAPGWLLAVSGSFRMRAPTDAERGCALVLLKVFCLLLLYASAFIFANRYLLGGS